MEIQTDFKVSSEKVLFLFFWLFFFCAFSPVDCFAFLDEASTTIIGFLITV